MAATPILSEKSSQPQCPAQHCPHAHSSCNSTDRKIVCDACCGSCMVVLLPVFTCSATLTPPSTPQSLIRDAEWFQSTRASQLDATRGPNVDLGSMNSGGMALTISSLAEYTSYFSLEPLDDSDYITVSPRRLTGASTVSSLSPTLNYLSATELIVASNLTNSFQHSPPCPTVVSLAILFREHFSVSTSLDCHSYVV